MVRMGCAFLFRRLCNTKVCYSLSPSFSPSVLLPFAVLEGIRQQVAKNTKNSFDDFSIQAQNRSGTSAILTRPFNIVQ